MPRRRSDELAAIDEVMPLVDQFNALEHAQRLIFLDMVDPLPEEAAPTKKSQKKAEQSKPRKIQHCAVCNWTKRAALHKDTTRSDYHEFVSSEPGKSNGKSASKSSRATSLSSQLKSRVSEQREAATGRGSDLGSNGESCTECPFPVDDNIHHRSSHERYHPFSPAAPPAPTRSPANGASPATERNTRRSAPPSTPESDDGEGRSALSSTVGSGTEADAAGNAG